MWVQLARDMVNIAALCQANECRDTREHTSKELDKEIVDLDAKGPFPVEYNNGFAVVTIFIQLLACWFGDNKTVNSKAGIPGQAMLYRHVYAC